MGITNTIAQLKAYFDEWHTNDIHTTINNRLNALENKVTNIETQLSDKWNDTFYNKLVAIKNDYDKFLSGVVRNNGNLPVTLQQLADFKNQNKWVEYKVSNGTANWGPDVNSRLYYNRGAKLVVLRVERAHIGYVANKHKNQWLLYSKLSYDNFERLPESLRPLRTVHVAVTPGITAAIMSDGYIKFRVNVANDFDMYVNFGITYAIW